MQRYRARISGPLLDRIDLQLVLPPVSAAELAEPAGDAGGNRPALTTAIAVRLVCAARRRQLARQLTTNARLDPESTARHCAPGREGLGLLRRAAEQRGLSARSQHRVLRVARSIADLADRDDVAAADVAEALALRWED